MATPTPTNPIEALDVPLADVVAELERIRLGLPLTDPDRHDLDPVDTTFARAAATWSIT
ncbi:hypothetical protein ACFVSQ_13530 [Streptomyces niveus]|uniref:hypothetical protein n=1 Tax=Streptomyces niveus TaxID=193462 RepID=UPI0036E23B35